MITCCIGVRLITCYCIGVGLITCCIEVGLITCCARVRFTESSRDLLCDGFVGTRRRETEEVGLSNRRFAGGEGDGEKGKWETGEETRER